MNVNGDRYDYWRSQHRARLKSGESITDFCERRGIKASTYRQAVSRYGFTQENGTTEQKPKFIELTGGALRENCVLEIDYQGFQIRLFPGVDARVLKSTLEILGDLR